MRDAQAKKPPPLRLCLTVLRLCRQPQKDGLQPAARSSGHTSCYELDRCAASSATSCTRGARRCAPFRLADSARRGMSHASSSDGMRPDGAV